MQNRADFKTLIKKDLINHYDTTISEIDLQAQTLLIPLQDPNSHSNQPIDSSSKIEDIFKYYKKFINLVEKILDSNMNDIDNYALGEDMCENDKDAIKRDALKNYILYFKNDDLIHEIKHNSTIGYLFVYDQYLDLNMSDYIK